MSDLSASRRTLQARLDSAVRATLGGGPIPTDLEPRALSRCGRQLVMKRRRVVSKCAPSLVEALGAAFADRFDEFARACPRPTGEQRPDSVLFGRYLMDLGAFPAAAGREHVMHTGRRFVRLRVGPDRRSVLALRVAGRTLCSGRL